MFAVVGAALLFVAAAAFLSPPQERMVDLAAPMPPARVEPLIVGVGVHFGIGGDWGYSLDQSAAKIAELGIDSFRDDLPWASFNDPVAPGADHKPVKVFQFMRMTKARPLLAMGHPNPAAPDGAPPFSEVGRAGFADFAGRAAATTRSFNPLYEVWNEWNMNAVRGRPWLVGPGDPSDPRAAVHYAPLAKASTAAIAKNAPGAPILIGAVGIDEGWKWTEAILDMGALEGPSTLSVHFYNHCESNVADRTATQMIGKLTALQDMLKSKAGGKETPLYLTEFGWPTALKPCKISRETAADNIAQSILWAAATPWMKGAWIYQLKDQGRSLDDLEQNFGLYDYDYQPKPSACTAGEAIKIAKGAQSMAIERPFDDVFVVRLPPGAGPRFLAWTSREEVKANLFVATARGTAVRLCGGPATGTMDSGIELGPRPILFELDAGSPAQAKLVLTSS